jgi:hypothetical protein
MKSINELACHVTEEEYRKDPAISYSTLSRFEREGWRKIGQLFDKQETAALQFGGAVDCLLTDGEEAFKEKYFVADFPDLQDSIITIVKALFGTYSSKYRSISMIPDIKVMDAAVIFKYQSNWKPETRAKVIKEKGEDYYNLMYLAGDKIILSQDEYNEVIACIEELRSNDVTSFFFNGSYDESIEKVFQLKFKAEYEGTPLRCMFDELIVDHTNKIIYPIDLKTTGHPEEEFESSFNKWRYDIQAKLYTYILSEVIKNDDYFKDFKIEYYQFVTINKKTLAPVIWEFDDNHSIRDMMDDEGNVLRDWRKILDDLNYYLEHPQSKYSREVLANDCRMKIRNSTIA